jgi:hypothetical protein
MRLNIIAIRTMITNGATDEEITDGLDNCEIEEATYGEPDDEDFGSPEGVESDTTEFLYM